MLEAEERANQGRVSMRRIWMMSIMMIIIMITRNVMIMMIIIMITRMMMIQHNDDHKDKDFDGACITRFSVDQDFQGVCDDKPGFCAFLLTVSVTNTVSIGDNITTLKVMMIMMTMIIMMIIRWAPLFQYLRLSHSHSAALSRLSKNTREPLSSGHDCVHDDDYVDVMMMMMMIS